MVLAAIRSYGLGSNESYNHTVNFPPSGDPPGNIDQLATNAVTNVANVFKCAATGDPSETADAFFKGLSGRSLPFVEVQLRNMANFVNGWN